MAKRNTLSKQNLIDSNETAKNKVAVKRAKKVAKKKVKEDKDYASEE